MTSGSLGWGNTFAKKQMVLTKGVEEKKSRHLGVEYEAMEGKGKGMLVKCSRLTYFPYIRNREATSPQRKSTEFII